MILEMAQRINLAIGKGDILDLSAYTSSWSEEDKDFAFDVGMPCLDRSHLLPKKPIPNDYGIDFFGFEDSQEKLERYRQLCQLRLTFRDGQPVFDQGFKRFDFGFGGVLILKYGICLEGENFVPLVMYSLLLSPDGCSIEKDVSKAYDGLNPADAIQISEHEPVILETAHRINLAIGKGEALDLSAHTDFWFQRDIYFDFLVMDSSRFKVNSPDFQKKPILNDYGLDFWEAVR